MKLKDYLAREKLTASAFAEQVGVHVSAISRFARGHRIPDLALALKIRDASGGSVQPDDFIDQPSDEAAA